VAFGIGLDSSVSSKVNGDSVWERSFSFKTGALVENAGRGGTGDPGDHVMVYGSILGTKVTWRISDSCHGLHDADPSSAVVVFRNYRLTLMPAF
jgi:hypothetical protein